MVVVLAVNLVDMMVALMDYLKAESLVETSAASLVVYLAY